MTESMTYQSYAKCKDTHSTGRGCKDTHSTRRGCENTHSTGRGCENTRSNFIQSFIYDLNTTLSDKEPFL